MRLIQSPKELVKDQEDLEIREGVDTIQTTALMRLARILRGVLETWEDLLSLKLRLLTQVWNTRKGVIMIIIIIIYGSTRSVIVGYETPEKGWSTYRPKRFDYNNEDVDNSANVLRDNNNYKVTAIPIEIGALGTVTKGLVTELEDWEIRGRVETIQTTALLIISQNDKSRLSK